MILGTGYEIPPDEIRAAINHWSDFIREQRPIHRAMRDKGDRATPRERIEGANASIEAAGAAIIVNALTWALGKTSGPTVWVKVR